MGQVACHEALSDPDGFRATCTVEFGIEHSHHDLTARQAVAAGRAVKVDDPDACPDCGLPMAIHLDADEASAAGIDPGLRDGLGCAYGHRQYEPMEVVTEVERSHTYPGPNQQIAGYVHPGTLADTHQAADGTPHLAYFDKAEDLSFVWNGTRDRWVDVCHGGYGEPVSSRFALRFNPFDQPATVLFARFAAECQHYIDVSWRPARQREGMRP